MANNEKIYLFGLSERPATLLLTYSCNELRKLMMSTDGAGNVYKFLTMNNENFQVNITKLKKKNIRKNSLTSNKFIP